MTIGTELTLGMIRVQLRWLEREMAALRRLVDQVQDFQPQASFENLAGVWQDTIFSDEDIWSSRLRVAEDI
jgi:hypothetical protein